MSPLLLIGQNGKVSWPLQEHVCDFYQKLNDKITCRLFKTNINGGAIALGHPLGCTGCKLTIQNLHDMKRLKNEIWNGYRLRRRGAGNCRSY